MENRINLVAPCGIDCGICELYMSRNNPQLMDYLVSKGIPRDRMFAKGYGESRLKISDAQIAKLPESDREAAHQQNRRVEFEVLRSDYVPKE